MNREQRVSVLKYRKQTDLTNEGNDEDDDGDCGGFLQWGSCDYIGSHSASFRAPNRPLTTSVSTNAAILRAHAAARNVQSGGDTAHPYICMRDCGTRVHTIVRTALVMASRGMAPVRYDRRQLIICEIYCRNR